MYNLLKVEFSKLKKFYIGYLAVLFMFGFGLAYGGYRIGYLLSDNLYNTEIVFADVVSDTSFVFLISIVAALFIGKDFSNRTICNEIKLGYSRLCILICRMIVVCVFCALLHVVYIISAILGFSVVRNFDNSVLCIENVLWLLAVLMQLMAISSGVVLISFMAKRVAEAVTLSGLYAVICCNILRNFISSKIFTLSCFYFVQEKQTQNLIFAAVSSLITIIIVLIITSSIFNRTDIK